MILQDSGNRTEFESGAVRDMHEGKGRCDLMPLDVISTIFSDESGCVFYEIAEFQECGDTSHLFNALKYFVDMSDFKNLNDMLLEVAKHFEDGAKKYGENNWRKGIPANVYIDSAVRHLLKYFRGDTDERHDRAFCWNIICCFWTCKYKPELNSYRKEENKQ